MHNRVRPLNTKSQIASSVLHKPVVYWMSRDQRVEDNWAVLYAQQLALDSQSPLYIVFCLTSNFLGATERQYEFMLKGLTQLEQSFKDKGISFIILTGDPPASVAAFVREHEAWALVCDFSPLRIARAWKQKVVELLDSTSVTIQEVDAHNIVPCWTASPKQEFAARTFRPKIHKLLESFLTEFPKV